MEFDYLIVGAGLYGCTFAHVMRQSGKSCLIIDKRQHIGGNTYCKNEGGIQVHQYGAHIFHTSDEGIWQFVNRFVHFKPFINSPIAKYYNQTYPLPFNMNTFKALWGVTNAADAQAIIKEQTSRYAVVRPSNLKEQALATVGEDVFEKLIRHYTEKQWGMKCEELPAFLIKRIPLRFTFDNNYFDDTYQGIPSGGYNVLTSGLIGNTEVRLGVDYFKHKDELNAMANQVVYTGKIDAFFNYQFGELQYRSLRFDHQLLNDISDFQGNAVINHTSPDVAYTRVVEHKHFESVICNHTVVSYEYPQRYVKGEEAYYPINDEKNNALYQQYKVLANENAKVIFGGRLAEYKYYDMHQVIAAALTKAKKQLS